MVTASRPDLASWLALRLVPGVGSVRFFSLVKAFGSPEAVLAAPREALARVKGIGGELAAAIAGGRRLADPERELARLARLGGRVVLWGDEEYPPLLAAIYAPPPLLFVRGSLVPCRPGGVAAVGSRAMSPYGRRVASELGRDLARAGVSLVSGLARGIDTAAHQGALQAGGHTVGVLGCGLARCYPPENRRLAEEMAAKGALVSEFPLDTPPLAANFPVRNRVFSGLSRAVVVVEGGGTSGSLITARHALDQGREVFAVPGPLGTPGVEGTHELLRQGARLFSSVRDLLEALGAPGADAPAAAPAEAPPAAELPPEAAALLKLLGPAPVHVDVLCRESGLKPQEAGALLVNLELAGLVNGLPGRHYVLAG